MSPIAIAATAIGAVVIIIVFLVMTALRGKKREGKLGAESKTLQESAKAADEFQKKMSRPLVGNAKRAWEHYKRVRSYSDKD